VNRESRLERNFWRYWLGGLLLLALMIVLNSWLSTGAARWGIRDHQSAGSAVRIDAIQFAWQRAGVLSLARFSIALDLVYIAIYSFGAYCGGRMLMCENHSGLKRLGGLIAATSVILAIADYAETICEFIQIIGFKGSDVMAQIAATAQPVKTLAFIVTFLGVIAGLILRRYLRRGA
jgi:hypothetical protein